MTWRMPSSQSPMAADWQPMSVIAGRQQTPTNLLPTVRPNPAQPRRASDERKLARPIGFLTPHRRAQMVALLTVSIAICIGVLITLFLVGS